MRTNMSEQRIELNRETSVTIRTKKKEKVYTHKVTLTRIYSSLEPLSPQTHQEVIDMIGEFDLNDDQTNLFPEEV